MNRPGRPCSGARCPNLQPCPAHPHVKHQYDAAHRRRRDTLFLIQPRCQGCGALGRESDHADHIDARGADTVGNLQRLCVSCHSKKTVALDGGFGR